jgi:CheY-like chemotaxis protein
MFEMYSQNEPFVGSETKGLGIGLALVKWLVELHQGNVTASSAGPGKGAEFVVHLPMISAAKAQAKVSAASLDGGKPASQANAAAKKKVLLVDDNRDGADALKVLLGFEGHEVSTAYDGSSGLETAVRFHPDVAVIDLQLPGMNGFELAKKLREILPNARLIALSGRHLETQEPELRMFHDYLRKPIELQELTKLLD